MKVKVFIVAVLAVFLMSGFALAAGPNVKTKAPADTAWKYDKSVNPSGKAQYGGFEYRWIEAFAYTRTGKDGKSKVVNVRGHWRKVKTKAQPKPKK